MRCPDDPHDRDPYRSRRRPAPRRVHRHRRAARHPRLRPGQQRDRDQRGPDRRARQAPGLTRRLHALPEKAALAARLQLRPVERMETREMASSPYSSD